VTTQFNKLSSIIISTKIFIIRQNIKKNNVHKILHGAVH